MKTPVEFFRELPSYHPETDQWCINALVARDKEIKVEALREVMEAIRPRNPGQYLEAAEAIVHGLIERAERGE